MSSDHLILNTRPPSRPSAYEKIQRAPEMMTMAFIRGHIRAGRKKTFAGLFNNLKQASKLPATPPCQKTTLRTSHQLAMRWYPQRTLSSDGGKRYAIITSYRVAQSNGIPKLQNGNLFEQVDPGIRTDRLSAILLVGTTQKSDTCAARYTSRMVLVGYASDPLQETGPTKSQIKHVEGCDSFDHQSRRPNEFRSPRTSAPKRAI